MESTSELHHTESFTIDSNVQGILNRADNRYPERHTFRKLNGSMVKGHTRNHKAQLCFDRRSNLGSTRGNIQTAGFTTRSWRHDRRRFRYIEAWHAGRQTRCFFIRSQQAGQLRSLQNKPFRQAPGAAAPLIFEVHPFHFWAGMSKCFPQHRHVFFIEHKTGNMPDADADTVWITARSPVSDVQRMMSAFAPPTQKLLVPAARC